MSKEPVRPPSSAAELFGAVTGTLAPGDVACHYCGCPCPRGHTHQEPPPVVGVRPTRPVTARLPHSPWACAPCRTFRQRRRTVLFLGGGYRDGQSLGHWGCYCTPAVCASLREQCYPALYERLLRPPRVFFLGLLEGAAPPELLLQLQCLNDNAEVRSDTVLRFTVNNAPHAYTVYELEQAIALGPAGRDPGAQALLRVLGAPPQALRAQLKHREAPVEVPEKRERGRPTVEEAKDHRVGQERRQIRQSGGGGAKAAG